MTSSPLNITHPADTYATVGERYRLVYQFVGLTGSAEIHATWPQAIANLVDQNPYFRTLGWSLAKPQFKVSSGWSLAGNRVIVDVEVISIPSDPNLASLESMLDSSRRFQVSNTISAEIVVVQQITADMVDAGSRQESAAAQSSVTVWKAPDSLSQVDTTLSPFDRAILSIGGTFSKVPGAIGNAVGDIANGIAQRPAIIIVVAVAVYLYFNRKGA